MSNTTVDMAKVSQMLDTGWIIRIYKGPMGSYEVRARHKNKRMIPAALAGISAQVGGIKGAIPFDADHHTHDGWLMTDDFTPEQALTRMAYKVQGQIL